MNTMSFIRCKKRGDKKYYYEVENKWVNGKVRQKVIKYLGTSPFKQRRREVNDFEAYLIAETIMKHTPSREGVLEVLKSMGIPIPMELKGVVKSVALEYDMLKKTTYLVVK